MLESVIAAVAGPDGVEAYVAAMLQDRYKRSDQYAPRSRKKCEDCQLKQPSFGLPAEGRTRWCSGCAKAHAGAEDVTDGSNNSSGRGTCGRPLQRNERLSAAAAAAAVADAVDNAPAPRLIGATAEKGGPPRVAWRLRQAEADRLQLRLDRMVL